MVIQTSNSQRRANEVVVPPVKIMAKVVSSLPVMNSLGSEHNSNNTVEPST